MKEYNNTKTLSIIYTVYIMIFAMTCILMYTGWFPWQFNFLRHLFSFLCLFAYFPIVAIIYGSYSYIKTQEIVVPGLLYGLGYLLLAIISFCVWMTAGAGFNYSGTNDWWVSFSLTMFVAVDLYFWIKLPLVVVLSIVSSLITKLIVSQKRAKKVIQHSDDV